MSLRSPSLLHKWKSRHQQHTRSNSHHAAAPPTPDTLSHRSSPVPGLDSKDRERERPRTFGSLPSWLAGRGAAGKGLGIAVDTDLVEGVEEGELRKIVEEAVRSVLLGEVEGRMAEAVKGVLGGLGAEVEKMRDGIGTMRSGVLNLEGEIGKGFEGMESRLENQRSTTDKGWERIEEVMRRIDGLEGEMKRLEGVEKEIKRLRSVEKDVKKLDVVDKEIKGLRRDTTDLDLKAAIRFGEISNEFQDREKMIMDRLWSIESELSRKLDGLGRRMSGLSDDVGRFVKEARISGDEEDENVKKQAEERHELIMDEASKIHQAMEDIAFKMTSLENNHTIAQTREQSSLRDVQSIRRTVEALDLSPLASQAKRLEGLERYLSELKRELDTQGTLASLDSKLISAHGTKLDKIMNEVAGAWVDVRGMLKAQNELAEQSMQNSEQNFEGVLIASNGLEGALKEVRKQLEKVFAAMPPSTTDKLEAMQSTLIATKEASDNLGQQVANIDNLLVEAHAKRFGELATCLSDVQTALRIGFEHQTRRDAETLSQLQLLPTSQRIAELFTVLEHIINISADGSEAQRILLENITRQVEMSPSLEGLDNRLERLDHLRNDVATLQADLSQYSKPLTARIDTLHESMRTSDAERKHELGVLQTELRANETAVVGRHQWLEETLAHIGPTLEQIREAQYHSKTQLDDLDGSRSENDSVYRQAFEELRSVLQNFEKTVREHHNKIEQAIGQNQEVSLHSTLKEIQDTQIALKPKIAGFQERLVHNGDENDKRFEDLRFELHGLAALAREHHGKLEEVLGIQGDESTIQATLVAIQSAQQQLASTLEVHDEKLDHQDEEQKSYLEAVRTKLDNLADAVSHSYAKLQYTEGQIQNLGPMMPAIEAIREAQSQINSKLDSHDESLTESDKTLEEMHSTLISGIDKGTHDISTKLEAILVAQISQSQVIEQQHLEKHSQVLAAFSNAISEVQSVFRDSHNGLETGVASIAEQIDGLNQNQKSRTSALSHTLSALHTTLKEFRLTLETSLSSLTSELLMRHDQHAGGLATLEEAAIEHQSRALGLHETTRQAVESQKPRLDGILDQIASHREILDDIQAAAKSTKILKQVKALEKAQDAKMQLIFEQLDIIKEANIMTTIRDEIAALQASLSSSEATLVETIGTSNEDIKLVLQGGIQESHTQTREMFRKPFSSLKASLHTVISGLSTSTADMTTLFVTSLQDTQTRLLQDLQSPLSEISTKIETLALRSSEGQSSLRSDMRRFDPKKNGMEEMGKSMETIPQLLPAIILNSTALKKVDSRLLDTSTTFKELLLEGNGRVLDTLRSVEGTLEGMRTVIHQTKSALGGLQGKHDETQTNTSAVKERIEGLTVQLEGVEKGVEVIGKRVVGTRRGWEEAVSGQGSYNNLGGSFRQGFREGSADEDGAVGETSPSRGGRLALSRRGRESSGSPARLMAYGLGIGVGVERRTSARRLERGNTIAVMSTGAGGEGATETDERPGGIRGTSFS